MNLTRREICILAWQDLGKMAIPTEYVDMLLASWEEEEDHQV